MPTTVALVPFNHPDTGKPIAAGGEVTVGDEDYALLRADGKIAASEEEQKAGATPEAQGNYTSRTGRPDSPAPPRAVASEPVNAPEKKK